MQDQYNELNEKELDLLEKNPLYRNINIMNLSMSQNTIKLVAERRAKSLLKSKQLLLNGQSNSKQVRKIIRKIKNDHDTDKKAHSLPAVV